MRRGPISAAPGLILEGSILAYNATRDEAEWVPTCGITNDLSWAEERMAVMLANFVPRIPQEADHIAELRARYLLGWADNSPSDTEELTKEEDEPEEVEEQEEEDPMNVGEETETKADP